MFRLRDGNDALPSALAAALRGRVCLSTALTAITRRGSRLQVSVRDRAQQQLTADYAVVTLPASTLRSVRFEPALPAPQWQAISTLRYGRATRVLLQFESRFWKHVGRPIAYGTDQPTGAVWDGNEQQDARPGILSLLAGGRASTEVRTIIDTQGWRALVKRLAWLGTPSRLLHGLTVDWDRDKWSKGGYAVFDTRFDPALRPWLARPAGRIVFAGEHTSTRWQGYMNGAIESGRRAALEVALMAGLDYRALFEARQLPTSNFAKALPSANRSRTRDSGCWELPELGIGLGLDASALVCGSSASSPHVSGSCETSVDR